MGFIYFKFLGDISFSTDNLISWPINTDKLGLISCPGTEIKIHEILVPVWPDIGSFRPRF